jgi:serine protease inhibitor
MARPARTVLAWLAPAALGGLGAIGCDGDAIGPVPEIDQLPRALTVAEQTVIRSSNAFGFDLFGRVYARESGPNTFLSPLSASMALGMTMNGAAGETWDAMRTALHFDGLSEAEINTSYRGLMDVLLDLDPLVQIRIGNSVWARQGFPFEPAFFTAVGDYFDAEARELDFNRPGAVDVINLWASDATNGRIDKVLDSIDPAHIMFLLNALYFKGTWERQFDEDETRGAPFTRADGSRVTVPMMHLPEGAVLATTTPDYQAVELPYGGKAFAMTIVLPSAGRTLSDLVGGLDSEGWAALVAGLDSTNLEIRLPRFRFEYEELLNRALQDMGMRVAFTTAADFTRLTPAAHTDPVCIHFVKQNTFVEVNEEGTEAAAVTTVGIGIVSARPSFIVDRPFLFAIRERLSGTILFLGAIGDPSLTESEPADAFPPVCSGG